MHENEIGTVIVDCAVHLHQTLGPGLLESVYEATLARQLEKRGLTVQRQVAVPFNFEGEQFEEGFRADLVVDGKVIVELKSVEKVNPAHKKQLLTCLRLTRMKDWSTTTQALSGWSIRPPIGKISSIWPSRRSVSSAGRASKWSAGSVPCWRTWLKSCRQSAPCSFVLN